MAYPNYGNPWMVNPTWTNANTGNVGNQNNMSMNQNQLIYGNQQQNDGSLMTVFVRGEAGANAYRYPSYAYGDYSERYRDSYGERMHDGSYDYRSHDRGSYRYDGDSYRRGRSPVTGRYISRGHEEGYSGHSIMDRMVDRLESMYDEAKTDHEKQTVPEWINRLRNSN